MVATRLNVFCKNSIETAKIARVMGRLPAPIGPNVYKDIWIDDVNEAVLTTDGSVGIRTKQKVPLALALVILTVMLIRSQGYEIVLTLCCAPDASLTVWISSRKV
ncbi:uncharacterized protein EAF01_010973 [Botrytis porri]|uniref:Uncharacterized protein n=1 Tax=Botrytis porri TaxID=87229 RepID=A0A4Z1KCU9_9HELO|nr:uncharacterized protein EAF01_010973 [Botrytis porri]KAF7887819.1 hypothetical protein EAF01_010973 [Botrytis porri]TGO82012.1 hypothetical protein BPOR_0944g00010 [Botrytis porri]